MVEESIFNYELIYKVQGVQRQIEQATRAVREATVAEDKARVKLRETLLASLGHGANYTVLNVPCIAHGVGNHLIVISSSNGRTKTRCCAYCGLREHDIIEGALGDNK